LPETDKSFQTTLVTIDKSPISAELFCEIYCFSKNLVVFLLNQSKIGRRFVPKFLDEQLAQYYNDNLEKKNFLNLMQLWMNIVTDYYFFDDGKEIWQRSKQTP
jgi:hypothetical protein